LFCADGADQGACGPLWRCGANCDPALGGAAASVGDLEPPSGYCTQGGDCWLGFHTQAECETFFQANPTFQPLMYLLFSCMCVSGYLFVPLVFEKLYGCAKGVAHSGKAAQSVLPTSALGALKEIGGLV